MSARQLKITDLTPDEDALYSAATWEYLTNVRNDSKRADRYAWKRCVEEFPRLKEFDGATA